MSVLKYEHAPDFDISILTSDERSLLRNLKTAKVKLLGRLTVVFFPENGDEIARLLAKLQEKQFIIGPLSNQYAEGQFNIVRIHGMQSKPVTDGYACLLTRDDMKILGIPVSKNSQDRGASR